MLPGICLISPKNLGLVIQRHYLDLEFALCVIIEKKKAGGGETFLLISSTHSKVLEVNIMVRSGSFRHAV